MDKFKKLKLYALKKKTHQIDKHNGHYTNSMRDIQNFIEGVKGRSIIGLKFERISTWLHWEFMFNFLNNEKIDSHGLDLSTIFALESVNWDYFLGKDVEKYNESIQFHKAIKHMAQALLLGWDELAVKYGHLLIKMLYGKQYEGWHPAYKHPWFMLEIFCKWQKIELDYSKLNYPKDMGVYIEALKCWDTTDTTLLAKIINDLTDFHIAESDENEYEDRTPDFPSSDYFIFPIEMLLWLNIRQRIGLPDYTPDNELMNMPINNWHTQQTEIPRIEIIERAKQKLLQDCPEISFEL